MPRTMVDLDDALLAEAAEILGTTTKRATINGALAEFVAAARRRRFVELMDEGAFDDLRDPEVMRGGVAMKYLVDRRAWARMHVPTVRDKLIPLLERGLLATCAVVDLEILYSARNVEDHARGRSVRRGSRAAV
ncbi:type II toxin-antitoxin system VapB family antitoxin [Streptomyces sp. NPDC003042]